MTRNSHAKILAVLLFIGTMAAMGPHQGIQSTLAQASNPGRLLIPAIGVDAVVQIVGRTATGDMAAPTNTTDVGWYALGPIPGELGTAVIAGHLNGASTPRAVFYNLQLLQPGDVLSVKDGKDRVLNFRVTHSALYDYDEPTDDVFLGDQSVARLNLITCAGRWLSDNNSYSKRVVVFTELVPTTSPSTTNTPR